MWPFGKKKERVQPDSQGNTTQNQQQNGQTQTSAGNAARVQSISREEQERLTNTVLTPKGLNRKCVGRSARTLLSMIGIEAPSNIRCIVFEGEKEHPLISEELMMPILGLVRAKDFDDAVEKAVWLEHGNRHSAHIHSKNIDNITKYARAIDTAISW